MAIEVACPQCSKRLKAPDDSAGRKVRCSKCNNSFRLPGGDAADYSDDSTPSAPAAVSDNPFDFLGGSSPEPAETEVDEAPPPPKKQRPEAVPPPPKRKPEPEPVPELDEVEEEEELFTAPPMTESGPPSLNPFSFESGTPAPAPEPVEDAPAPTSRKSKPKRDRTPEPVEDDLDEPRPTKRAKPQPSSNASPLILMAVLTMMAMGLGLVIGGAAVYFLVK